MLTGSTCGLQKDAAFIPSSSCFGYPLLAGVSLENQAGKTVTESCGNNTHTQPFCGPFSGTTRVSWCQKKTSSGIYGSGRHRQTHRQSGCASHLHHPPFFTPDALPATTLPLYPGLGQAPNMLACLPSGMVAYPVADASIIQYNIMHRLIMRA